MVYDVVVSYAREDREVAAKLCNQLDAEGVTARIASREKILDANFASEMIGLISDAKALVVVVSSYSIRSGQVIRELELANQNRLKILPVRLDDVKPSGSLAYYLSGKHWFTMLRKEVEPWETAHKISRYLQTGAVEPEMGKKKSRLSFLKFKRK
jgi:hypothetical protein